MRYKRKELAHVETRTTTSRIICDGCGERTDTHHTYEGDDITIEARVGTVYPETDCRTLYEADVCSQCFVDKVIPALAAVGISVRDRDSDSYDVNDDGRVWEATSTPMAHGELRTDHDYLVRERLVTLIEVNADGCAKVRHAGTTGTNTWWVPVAELKANG